MAIINGGIGDDIITGGNGDDTINGLGGNDTLDGGGASGSDTINGGDGDDTITGNNGADTLNGDAGDDTIYGGNQNDTISGGDDNDTLFGEEGVDTISGGAGNDDIDGGQGSDTLYGNDGDDVLDGGGNGQDTLVGGLGDDDLTGGSAPDEFIFNFDVDSQLVSTTYNFVNDWDHPAQQAALVAWNNSYAAWVAWMESQGEVDWGAADAFSQDVNWQSGKKAGYTGKFIETFTQADVTATVTSEVLTVTGEGHDTVIDFNLDDEGDTLTLNGLADLSEAEFSSLFDVSTDGSSTLLSWSGGSITIVGLSLATDAAFFAQGTTDGWFA